MNRQILMLLAALVLISQVSVFAEEPTYLQWNQPADKRNCPADQDAVWVEYPGGQDCIRYFFGGRLDDAPLAIVRFSGDRSSFIGRDPADIPGNTAEAQRTYAERTARALQLPFIFVARPGTYGSSGDHRRRRQVEEFLALHVALDEIRNRHRFGQAVLLGHSGGATAAAALLTFGRTDVACVVLTSGAFDLLERARMHRERAGEAQRSRIDLTGFADPYDPLEHIAGIADDPDRVILVIGNEKDRVTPFVLQQKFAEALAAHGHNVQLLSQPAEPSAFHNLKGAAGIRAAASCAERRP